MTTARDTEGQVSSVLQPGFTMCGVAISDPPPTCTHTHAQPCNTGPPAFREILSTHCAFLKSACLLALHTLSSVQLLLIFTVLTRLTSFYWLFSSLNSFHLHFAVFLSPDCKTRSNPFGTHIFPSGGGHTAYFPRMSHQTLADGRVVEMKRT